MSRKVLGIDIRSASATAVLIETSLKKSAVIGFIHAPFPEVGEYHERLASAFETISREMDLKEYTCAVSVPSNRFFYRNATVPFSETKKIQQMLPYELESTIPLPVDEFLIEFKKLPIPGPDGDTRIIAAGIEVAWLKSVLTTIETSGITPNTLSPGGYFIVSWICGKDRSHENLLFVDFDGADCALYLMLSGKIVFIRSFPIPAEEANSDVKLWGYIQRSLAGFESLTEVKVSPDAVIINGFDDDSFADHLEEVCSIPVKVLDVTLPEGSVTIENSPPFLPRSCFNGALACALSALEGVKGMNFRKGPLAARNRVVEYREALIKTSVIAGVVLLLWLSGVLTNIHMTRKKVDQFQSRIIEALHTTFPDIKRIVDPVKQMNAEIAALKKAAFASDDTVTQLHAVDMLNEISKRIPAETDVHFTKLSSSEDGILITGTTDSFSSADDIKTRLEKAEGFISVKLTSTEKDGDRVRFKLKIQVSPEQPS